MDYEEVLKHLCALPGPSGFESPVAQAAAELLRTLVDEVRVDRMGSVVGLRRCGKENAPRLLLDAHLDEIGFLITGHEDGYLRFAPLGGVDPRMLPDRELTILTQPPRLGVVACMPPHVQTAEDMNKPQPIKDLYIDVGLSQEEAERLIPVGTPAVYRAGCTRLGDKLLCGKALDDRACCAAVILAAEELAGKNLPLELSYVFTTMEEVGSQGAVTAAGEIAPDYAVALDVSFAVTPDVPARNCGKMGGGVMLGIAPILDNGETDRVRRVAKEQELPLQFEVMGGSTGTDADCIAASGSGVRTVLFSIPQKYMHTPVETVAPEDVKATAELLCAYITDLARDLAKEGN